MKASVIRSLLCLSAIVLLLGSVSFAEGSFIIDDTEGATGGIKIDNPVDSVYLAYPEKQIKLENMNGYAEGQFYPGLSVYFDDTEKISFDVIIGWKDAWIIESINIYDKRFKTTAGFTSGSTIKQLKSKYKLKNAVFYEGRLYITAKGFNGTFISQFGGIPEEFIEKPDQSVGKIPDELVIELIRI